jgi:hypothetical protein
VVEVLRVDDVVVRAVEVGEVGVKLGAVVAIGTVGGAAAATVGAATGVGVVEPPASMPARKRPVAITAAKIASTTPRGGGRKRRVPCVVGECDAWACRA